MKLDDQKSALTLCISAINSNLLREINLQVIRVESDVKGAAQDHVVILDTSRQVATVVQDLSVIGSQVGAVYTAVPEIATMVTTIHSALPDIESKLGELPKLIEGLLVSYSFISFGLGFGIRLAPQFQFLICCRSLISLSHKSLLPQLASSSLSLVTPTSLGEAIS